MTKLSTKIDDTTTVTTEAEWGEAYHAAQVALATLRTRSRSLYDEVSAAALSAAENAARGAGHPVLERAEGGRLVAVAHASPEGRDAYVAVVLRALAA